MSQHMDALRLANEARLRHARIKAEIAGHDFVGGLRHVARLLRDIGGEADDLRLDCLLLAVPRIRHRSIAELLALVGVRDRQRRVRELTERQRLVLAADLEWRADWRERRRGAA